MSETDLKPRTKPVVKTERPKLHKVILFNDDYTPREFVTIVLKGEFHLNEDQAYRVMMTAHRKGVCVVSVYPRDIAETKARGRPRQAPPRAIRCVSTPSRRNRAPLGCGARIIPAARPGVRVSRSRRASEISCPCI